MTEIEAYRSNLNLSKLRHSLCIRNGQDLALFGRQDLEEGKSTATDGLLGLLLGPKGDAFLDHVTAHFHSTRNGVITGVFYKVEVRRVACFWQTA